MDQRRRTGIGKTCATVETAEGKLIDARRRARYVRLVSNGSDKTATNHYIEVEIFGQPVKYPEEVQTQCNMQSTAAARSRRWPRVGAACLAAPLAHAAPKRTPQNWPHQHHWGSNAAAAEPGIKTSPNSATRLRALGETLEAWEGQRRPRPGSHREQTCRFPPLTSTWTMNVDDPVRRKKK